MTLTEDALRLSREAVDSIVSAMDERFDSWDIWRTHDGRWLVKAKVGCQEYQRADECMISSMNMSLGWKPLPLVPRCPTRLDADRFTAHKAGSWWELRYDNEFWYRFPTKKAALAAAEKLAAKSHSDADAWHEEHGWTIHHIEGKGFRYMP